MADIRVMTPNRGWVDAAGTDDGRVITTTKRRSQTTKALAAAGNYAANDVLSESATVGTCWTFKEVLSKGGKGRITQAVAECETAAVLWRLRLYLYADEPTGILNDNVANTNPAHVDKGFFIGYIDFPAMGALGTADTSAVANTNTPASNIPLDIYCRSNLDEIYGVLVTRDAEANETATDDMTITLYTEED